EKELEGISRDMNVLFISDVLNAVGNNILVNNNRAIVHPDFDSKTIDRIKDTLDVEVVKGTLAKQKTVGAQGVVTNKGILCHPHTS
ncbi:MAG: translation initiation factor eIF-6, partial [Candidatus Thorarchaeota archaeon]|nr:translation initiation factor eIF-6 [Candidatus Thorarchaeota archaeon]NIW14138.1 translation initiation factor eIF-6 [Candidatus Thorarchaeota archaeon]